MPPAAFATKRKISLRLSLAVGLASSIISSTAQWEVINMDRHRVDRVHIVPAKMTKPLAT